MLPGLRRLTPTSPTVFAGDILFDAFCLRFEKRHLLRIPVSYVMLMSWEPSFIMWHYVMWPPVPWVRWHSRNAVVLAVALKWREGGFLRWGAVAPAPAHVALIWLRITIQCKPLGDWSIFLNADSWRLFCQRGQVYGGRGSLVLKQLRFTTNWFQGRFLRPLSMNIRGLHRAGEANKVVTGRKIVLPTDFSRFRRIGSEGTLVLILTAFRKLMGWSSVEAVRVMTVSFKISHLCEDTNLSFNVW